MPVSLEWYAVALLVLGPSACQSYEDGLTMLCTAPELCGKECNVAGDRLASAYARFVEEKVTNRRAYGLPEGAGDGSEVAAKLRAAAAALTFGFGTSAPDSELLLFGELCPP